MDITTLSAVKALKDTASTGDDSRISSMITAVSRGAEILMGRHVEDTSRTVTLRAKPGQTRFWLEGFPVSTLTSVKIERNPHDLATSTAIASTGYWMDNETGTLELLDYEISYEPTFVQIAYSGGMADSTANFMTLYPKLSEAANWQVIHQLQRARTPGGEATPVEGGGVMYESELDYLKLFKGACASHRRFEW